MVENHNELLFNKLRQGRNGRVFANDNFTCIFFNESIWISINISFKFVPKGEGYSSPKTTLVLNDYIFIWNKDIQNCFSSRCIQQLYGTYCTFLRYEF